MINICVFFVNLAANTQKYGKIEYETFTRYTVIQILLFPTQSGTSPHKFNIPSSLIDKINWKPFFFVIVVTRDIHTHTPLCKSEFLFCLWLTIVFFCKSCCKYTKIWNKWVWNFYSLYRYPDSFICRTRFNLVLIDGVPFFSHEKKMISLQTEIVWLIVKNLQDGIIFHPKTS